uniref:GTP binding protein 3, mitochondrial n=1 Tax=Cynoglossus semilaevis TaxID=244447 RepID=A0A3P8WHQ8_CYNSE
MFQMFCRGILSSAVHSRKVSRGHLSWRLQSTCEAFPAGLADADTIFALSSGHGRCGVAVVRVSGPASATALKCMAGLKRNLPPPRTALLRSITDPKGKEVLDRGLVLWFPGSMSGMRPAEAGEFTRRAFQAGKLDLTEVEGLADLIHAETEAQRRQALRQMSGELGQLYQNWSHRLKQCLAHVEAFIDFSEDELIEDGILSQVDTSVYSLLTEMDQHLKDQRKGERLRSGVQVVIAGATNAGKSSLLNTLCQRPAAIVSPVAGTTRDVVETALDIGGFPVLLSDTAGLRNSPDAIEREGVRRARERLDQADLTLVVVDCVELPRDPRQAAAHLKEHLNSVLPTREQRQADRCLVVLNKTDLLPEGERQQLDREVRQVSGLPPVCLISCHTTEGLQLFLTQLQSNLKTLCGNPQSDAPTLTQARHTASPPQCT